MNVRRSFWMLVLALLILALTGSVQAQGESPIQRAEAEYRFGKTITFRAEAAPDLNIQEALLILEAPGTPSFTGSANFSPGGEIRFTYNLTQRPLPPFVTVSYHYRLILESGEELTTDRYTFSYHDNRMDWQQLQEGDLTIYWYQGDLPFARQAADAAEKGRTKILDLLQQPELERPIDIYLYTSDQDLETTLAVSGANWAAGHAQPELGSVVVSVPPGPEQALEIQQQIPHEIAHIVLYRFMGSEYQYLPAWVSEGIASQVEFFPHPEYQIRLEKAHDTGDLIPLAQLCQAMPTDSEQAVLAYAQADSVLEYIRQEYGVTAVQAMIAAYDRGVGCERGVEIALGIGLNKLEKEWSGWAFTSPRLSGLRLLFLPWVVVTGLIAIPLLGIYFLRLYLQRDRNASEEDYE